MSAGVGTLAAMGDRGVPGAVELWLATESGPLLHRPVLDAPAEALPALCSGRAAPVTLGWYAPADSPFAPLALPRPLLGSWPAAVRAWAPVAESFRALRCMPPAAGATLRLWLSVWAAVRTGELPGLSIERYAKLRAQLPQPAADHLAIAGVSGISGLCATCRSSPAG